jgi:nitroimidazol reductase NimA-like FMN-containing flavoprotein (pyridoxamine 5'-phosphate oxidase superfamily)
VGGERRLQPGLTVAESLDLLGSVPLGRIGFTSKALPVIRPVTHVVDGGAIVVRSHEGAAIVSAARAAEGVVVAYEADAIDLAEHLGWSVVVTGLARVVSDPAEITRYQRLLRPWAGGQRDYVLRIHPEMVTGFRLVAEENATEPDPPKGSFSQPVT